MKVRLGTILVVTALALDAVARLEPRPALAARLAEGPEIIGIVHWGLNTYTDREWGFGDEDPAMLNPKKFDADQIVGALQDVSFKLYRADPELVRLVLSAATESGETDTAKWMTAGQ